MTTAPRYVIGSFAHEDDLMGAVGAARDAGIRIEDAYTPYAVHGLESAIGLRPSRLTWVCFLLGALGVGLTLLFEYWTSAFDWPINVGGKPHDSLPAFFPIAFEMAVLFGGLGVVIAMLVRNGLRPGKRARLPAPRVTDDRFALVLQLTDASRSADDIRTLLEPYGLEDWQERIGEGVA